MWPRPVDLELQRLEGGLMAVLRPFETLLEPEVQNTLEHLAKGALDHAENHQPEPLFLKIVSWKHLVNQKFLLYLPNHPKA